MKKLMLRLRSLSRETKAGIAVPCVFLSLVGAVVAVKLRPQEPPGDVSEGRSSVSENPPLNPQLSLSGPGERKPTPSPISVALNNAGIGDNPGEQPPARQPA